MDVLGFKRDFGFCLVHSVVSAASLRVVVSWQLLGLTRHMDRAHTPLRKLKREFE